MQTEEEKLPSTNAEWHVYIVRCNDGTLYTGITKQLEKRMMEHNSEQAGAKYTRFRQPVRLVYCEQAVSRSAAAKREHRLKRMSRKRKKELIDTGKQIGDNKPLFSERIVS